MTLHQVFMLRGIPFRLGGDRLKINLHCPFCVERGKTADTQFRLCVHALKGWGRCMHCDWSHRFAVDAVLKQFGIQDRVVGFEQIQQQVQPPPKLPEDFQRLTKVYDDLDRQARNYLLLRGVTPKQIREDRIGVSYEGRYAYRIIFPVYAGGKLVGINARDFTGRQTPKYLNSKGDKYLYRFDPEAETCVLSEGAFKALRLAQVTSGCSASVLGHDLTDQMLSQIKESRCRMVILYSDPDLVGRRGTITIGEKLKENWDGEVKLVLPIRLPADEEELSVMETLLAEAVPFNTHNRRFLLLNKK